MGGLVSKIFGEKEREMREGGLGAGACCLLTGCLWEVMKWFFLCRSQRLGSK